MQENRITEKIDGFFTKSGEKMTKMMIFNEKPCKYRVFR